MVAAVTVVGAGIAGAACAAALRAGGVGVDVVERGRAPGGRLAAPTLHGRRVDLGAAYFTVGDPEFGSVAAGWQAAGLARPWTDTLDALGAGGERQRKSGPMRWATRDGLRSLVRDLMAGAGIAPTTGHEVTSDVLGTDGAAVVLAMPDPQAARLAPGAADWVDYEPVISVAAGWQRRSWDLDAAAFVNGHPDVTLVADDGARRGDGAPVLVAHSSAELARRCLDDPDRAVGPVVAAVRELLGVATEPEWSHAHRWTFAKPVGTHGDAPFALTDHHGRLLGLCGDSWCPEGSPRVESAWLSGHRLGAALAARLTDL